MRRIAVINQKGGVGKTTTAANLGAALARAGFRVLLIDLDPQAHLSLHFGVELSDDQPSIYDVLTASVPLKDVSLNVRDNVTLIPSDIDLAGAEVELISVTGREVLLREALEPWADGFEYLLIDCPPSLGVLTINALVAADEVMIPLQTHFLALQGLSRLLDTVSLVYQRINPHLRVSGIVLCMHESTTRLAGEVVEDLTNFLTAARGTDVVWADARLYESCIRRNIKLAESSSFGQTVFDYAPRSRGAMDYARLAAELSGTGLTGESLEAPSVGESASEVLNPTPDSTASASLRPVDVPAMRSSTSAEDEGIAASASPTPPEKLQAAPSKTAAATSMTKP